MRLDVYLVENKICSSRDKAKGLIAGGFVEVNNVIVRKPSFAVNEADDVKYNEKGVIPYVSRGGLKLEKAIVEFKLNFNNKKVLDIGSSTGGFTDCALKHGASFVWAVDVGTDQLDQSLKADKRVCSIENTDFRNFNPNVVGGGVDVVVADLSFISLNHILGKIPQFLKPNGYAMLLIKPQFEAGPENVGKGGIVRDQKVHVQVVESIRVCALQHGLYLNKLSWAPIIDPRKNIEYLAMFEMKEMTKIDIKKVVINAFSERDTA